MRHLTLITTGGTIEKTYNERTGTLENRRSIVRRMLARLRLEGTSISTIELMSKDSLLMDGDDRRRVIESVRAAGGFHDPVTEASGIVILHGTDTLCMTGESVLAAASERGGTGPRIPIVLTGAMRPYEMKHSDAVQNLTEAVFATGVLLPGVYAVAHGRALRFPGVTKDRDRGTFVTTQPSRL
ncbi:MAG: asparaginase [Phycisphaerales bacterium]|nr:asparaginase [Phycisphaerales bacterium]